MVRRIFKHSFLFIISLLALSPFARAQELVAVDLGAIEGELKRIERTISWTNESSESVELGFWYASDELNVATDQLSVASGETVNIPVGIELPERIGDHEYELRILNEEKDLLIGYLFSFKKLNAESDVLKAYDNVFWPLWAKDNVFNLKRGFIGDTLQAAFDVYNFSGQELSFENLETDSIYQLHFEPAIIQHNGFARMTVSLVSEGLEGGFVKDRLDFYKGEKLRGSIPIQYTLIPKPQDAALDAARISISRDSHDFKVVKVGAEVTTSFMLRNRGAKVLDLSKIESNCDCLTYQLPKTELGIGEEVEMSVTFNAKNRIGLERKTLAIFSNDPEQPTQVITIRAHVK